MAKETAIRIGFRSGREVEVKLEEVTVTKSTRDNRVTAIRWSGGSQHILFIALDQIDYVLEEVG
jgi:hypothetical protein